MNLPHPPTPSPLRREGEKDAQIWLMRRDWQSIVLLVGLLIAYSLAWSNVETVGGLTNHATDLAEWVSIHPAVRGESLMLTPLLLRLPLALLACWWGITQARRGAWLPAMVIVGLLAVALMPPFEFFTGARGDPNYQQQFGLAIMALVGGVVAGLFGAARLPVRVSVGMGAAVLVLAGISAVWGTARALDLYTSLGVEAAWGVGAILFPIVCVLAIVTSLYKQGD
jgi:hypothetical protein